MSYADLFRPRTDVLSEGGIEGIIDLENLRDPKKRKLEARPSDFFSLTYPTADIRRVVETLHRRFSGDRDAPGLFLFEGLKGSGKSHLLLLVYHLFANPGPARVWLDQHELRCETPPEALVVIIKFTDLPLYSIWDYLFEQVTGRKPERSKVQPGLDEVKAVLSGRPLVLILDELEQGIRLIAEESARAQNVAFLQMLSEWGNRENQVTVFASIYSDQVEPGSTLKRVPCCRVRFEQGADKARVVLHRLFENYLSVAPESVRPTIESFVTAWRKHGGVQGDSLETRLREAFPFSPDLLAIMLDRIPARGGFQNVRGALAFLGGLVKLTRETADLITPAHADLSEREVAIRLADLDPSGDLIRRGQQNMKELESTPLVAGLGSAVMLYTLSGAGRERGATREELVRAVCAPGTDINQFEQALVVLQRYASHFHLQDGRYFFDPEENAQAKVEFRSLMVPEDRARSFIAKVWREELFRDPQAASVHADADRTREELESMEKGRLRFVLAPGRLGSEERRLIYHGLEERNQVILLEPKDASFKVLSDRHLLKWAQRSLAAAELVASTQEAARRDAYERIGRDDRKNILDQLRRAGLIYVRVEKGAGDAAEEVFEEEALGSAVTREDVIGRLSQEIYPIQYLAEHLAARLSGLRGRMVKDLDRDYRTILGYPVPTHTGSVLKAVRQLCKDGQIGVRHPRGDYSGRDPDLNDAELLNATVDAPFDRRPSVQIPFPGTPPPPGPGETPGIPAPTPGPPPLPPRQGTRDLVVAPQPSIGSLRQEVAARLQGLGSPAVIRVRFTVFLDNRSGDLSTLPAWLRGSLSGPGSLTAEITIAKENVGGKGDVEQLVERLPVVPGATYGARLEVSAQEPSEEDDPDARL